MLWPRSHSVRIRHLASDRCMGYQTLARQWLLERCAEEEAKAQAAAPGRKRSKRKGKSADEAAG